MYTKAVNSSHNWRRTIVRQDQSATRKCAVAHTYITRIIEDSLPNAFAWRTLKTSTCCAHMALQSSNGAKRNTNFTSLSPSIAVSLLNKIRFPPLDDLRALLARVGRLTCSIFGKFSCVFRNINPFGALVLKHRQVLHSNIKRCKTLAYSEARFTLENDMCHKLAEGLTPSVWVQSVRTLYHTTQHKIRERHLPRTRCLTRARKQVPL